MQHSIVARFASRPPTRFAPTPARARARRLGLRQPGFTPAPLRHTELRRPAIAPAADLRAVGRGARPPALRASAGLIRRPASMLWTSSARGGSPRRSFAAPAWRA